MSVYSIIETNQNFSLSRNSDGKIVSTHNTYDLAEYAMGVRLDYLRQTDNLCDCENWKGSDYETCYECKPDYYESNR